MASRVSSPAFVGREPELEGVLAALRRVGNGQPAMFLVAGEAGVGKTRFLHEVATDARARGFRVLEGGCVQMGAESLPFGPLVEALRGLPTQLAPDQLREAVGTGTVELAHLMPGLRRTANESAIQDASQGQTFEHLLLFLTRLAGTTPLVLLLEDIHWADRTTLEFLMFIARNLRDAPVVLVATYRSDELHRRHPLLPVLAELRRAGHIEQLELRRFDQREVAAQLAAILGREPELDRVESIVGRSDGNAFFVEELAAIDEREALPETLQDLLLVRIASLAEQTQEVVRVAAVAGPNIDVPTLATVMAREEPAIYAAIREAVDANVLAPTPRLEDRFAFRHALIQEAVYTDLLAGERTRLHEAFARAIEQSPGAESDASRAARLAYHWHAAHDLPRAFEASIRAGLAADAMYAIADARVNYERALELWDKVPDAGSLSPIDKVDLLVRLALSSPSLNTTGAGYVRGAIGLVDPQVDPHRAGLLRTYLANFYRLWDDAAALDISREAVKLIPEAPPTATRARALTQFAATLASVDRHTESLVVLDEALRTLRALPVTDPGTGTLESLRLDMTVPRRVESLVLEQQGLALAGLGDVAGGLRLMAESRRISEELGIVSRVNEVGFSESEAFCEAGRFEEALESALRGVEHAAAHGMTGFQGAINLYRATQALLALGRWDEAAARLHEADRVAYQATVRTVLDVHLAVVEVARGRFEDAGRRLTRHRSLARLALWPLYLSAFVVAEASLALWTGDPLAARAAIGEYLPRLELAPDIWIGHIGPVFALGIWAEADCALLAQRRESEEDRQTALATGRALLEGMRGVAADTAARRPVFSPQADAWLATCEAEATRLEGRSDADRWAAAGAAWVAVGMPYPRAYALMREGQALIAGRGDRARAAEAIRQGSAIAAELGARPLAERLEDLAGRLGMRPEAEGVPAGPAAAGGRYELTRREREILELLAAGRSDGEIAADLFISKKTVSVHINNIKGKLGAESRVGIIRTSAALGLIQMGARS